MHVCISVLCVQERVHVHVCQCALCTGVCALVLSAWSVQGVASHPFPGEVRGRCYFSPLVTPWRVILPEQKHRPEPLGFTLSLWCVSAVTGGAPPAPRPGLPRAAETEPGPVAGKVPETSPV